MLIHASPTLLPLLFLLVQASLLTFTSVFCHLCTIASVVQVSTKTWLDKSRAKHGECHSTHEKGCVCRTSLCIDLKLPPLGVA